jgi:hypothetical protein
MFTSVKSLLRLYDGCEGNIFSICRQEDIEVNRCLLSMLLTLADSELLEYTSTSPSIEPSHFAEVMRASLASVIDPMWIEKIFSQRPYNSYQLVIHDGEMQWQLS